jgi:hypothetical protein
MEKYLTKEFERYYGIVFTSLFDEFPDVSVSRFVEDNSAYILNESLGLYIKHATARVSPWNYSFRSNDFKIIKAMKENVNEIAFALVCGFHGVCVISSRDLEIVGGLSGEDSIRVTVRTIRGGSWRVSGSNDSLSTTRSKTKPWEKFAKNFQG